MISERAGIEEARGLHTLRHTCASLLLREKTDIKVISELLGHGSVQFTYDTYVHLIDGQKDEAVRGISHYEKKKLREEQKELVDDAVDKGLGRQEIEQLLATIPPERLGVLLAEIIK